MILLLIALSTTAAVSLFALGLLQQANSARLAVGRRIEPPPPGGAMLPPPEVRVRARSGSGILSRLPLSSESAIRLEASLTRGSVNLTPSEFVSIRLLIALAGLLVVALLVRAFGAPGIGVALAAAAGFGLGWFAVGRWLKRRQQQRLRLIEAQIPEALTSIAKSLRAGTGILQALTYAAEETDAPLGLEMQSMLNDLRLGGDPADAFQALAERTGSADLDLAVTAIVVQRTVGGNLAEILGNVASTVRDRAAFKREVMVLTSRQRLTANLMAAVPVAIAVLFLGTNRDLADRLLTTAPGLVGLAVGVFFELLGLVLVRKLAVIEV